jgi:hypothetical protein
VAGRRQQQQQQQQPGGEERVQYVLCDVRNVCDESPSLGAGHTAHEDAAVLGNRHVLSRVVCKEENSSRAEDEMRRDKETAQVAARRERVDSVVLPSNVCAFCSTSSKSPLLCLLSFFASTMAERSCDSVIELPSNCS